MKKSMIVLMVAWAMLSTAAKAQGPDVMSPDIQKVEAAKPGMGFNRLNLSEEQKAKLKVLHQEFAAQDSVSRNQIRAERETIREQRRKAMEQLLTSDQLEQLKMFREEVRPEGMGAGRKKDVPVDARFGQGQGFKGDRMTSVQSNKWNKKQAKAFRGQNDRHKAAHLVNPEERIKNNVDRMTKQLNLTADQAVKIQDIQKKYAKKEIARYQKVQKKMDAQKKKRNACMDEIKTVLTEDQAKKLEALKAQNQLLQPGRGPISRK
jgi:hypothetical protein